MIRDIGVIGAGPAGLTAGLYAGRTGADAVLFEGETPGGELVNRHRVENYPGLPEVSGPELRSILFEQFERYEIPLSLREVTGIRDEDPFRIVTDGGELAVRAVIVACGGRPAKLGVPGEEAYAGTGVFYCAKCDGPLYRDEVVAVAGGDDWAVSDALYLTEHASKVVVFEERPRLPAAKTLRERAASEQAIEVRTDAEITRVLGEDVVTGLEVVDSAGRTEVEAIDGLYVQRGIVPNAEFLADAVPTNDRGEIVVDERLATETEGIFAAGDVRSGSPRTIAAAVGDGATASRSVRNYLDSSEM